MTMEHLLLTFIVAVASSNKIKLQCAPGSYVLTPRIGPDICQWCTDGVNFIPRYPEFWHSNRACLNCTRVRDENLEVLVSPCNKTHDTEILCRDGYYRQRARNAQEKDTCVKCSDCEPIARQCQGYYDAVCCLPGYDAVLNKYGFFECEERPIVCGAGEFLSLKTEQCTPCPPGTFMTSDKHNHTNCQLCQTLDDVAHNHDILLPCNQTHPTIFGCKEGYFRIVAETTKENVSLCQPCTKCGDQQHEVRKCDRFQNTVCCDSAGMMVQDTDLGPRCQFNDVVANSSNITTDTNITGEKEAILHCEAGEYLYTNSTTNKTTCLSFSPCPCEDTIGQQESITYMIMSHMPIAYCSSTTTILCFLLRRRIKIRQPIIFQSMPDPRSEAQSKQLITEINAEGCDSMAPLMCDMPITLKSMTL